MDTKQRLASPARTIRRLCPASCKGLTLLLLFALIWGCAKQQPPVSDIHLSPKAEASYNYMLYLDRVGANDVAGAEKAINRLLQLDPSPIIYMGAGDFYWQTGRIGKARELFKKGIELDPDNAGLVLRLAESYAVEKRYEDASNVIDEYMITHADDKKMRAQYARMLIEEGRVAAALDVLAYIPAKERSSEVLYLQGRANVRLGLHKKAIDLLKHAVEKDSDNILAWAELAFVYESEKNYVEAEKTYSSLLDKGENAPEIWLRLVNLNLKLNNPNKALLYVESGPMDPAFQLEAARMFMENDFYDEAASILLPLEGADLPPEQLHFSLALLAYEGEKDSAKALEYLEKLPPENRAQAQVLNFKAHLLMDLNKNEEALAMVREGRKKFAGNKDLWETEAFILEESGDMPGALGLMKQAAEIWPDDVDILYRHGVLLEKNGDRKEALETMEHVIVLDQDHADALNFVGYILAEENHDLDRALVLVKTALALKPESGYILDSLAWIYYRKGQISDALAEIRKAVKQEAGDPTIWEHYGDINRAAGLTLEARKGYVKSLELGSENSEKIRKKLQSL